LGGVFLGIPCVYGREQVGLNHYYYLRHTIIA
jgi:hypothetical protein